MRFIHLLILPLLVVSLQALEYTGSVSPSAPTSGVSDLIVGVSSPGSLSISDGEVFSASGFVQVGQSGYGTLDINSGASFQIAEGGKIWIARYLASNGAVVTLNGEGSLLATPAMRLGNSRAGTLNITNNARVEVSGTIQINNNSSVIQISKGGTLQAGQIPMYRNSEGYESRGTFTIDLDNAYKSDYAVVSNELGLDHPTKGYASLNITNSNNLIPQNGESFLLFSVDTLLDNSPFRSFPEGSIVYSDEYVKLLITYAGGDGNDITLSVVSDLTFTLNSDGTEYSVTDCLESASGSLVIPNTYNGLPVTSIGDYAFQGCTNLSSITFEGDAPTFGTGVFTGSDSVTIYYYDDATGFSMPTFQGRPSQMLIRGFQIIEGDFTWHEAKADAEARGGRLAVLNTQEKIDSISKLLEEFESALWIGLTDEVDEGVWEWINGEALSIDNWWTGQPDNKDGTEHYAHINSIERGVERQWNDNGVSALFSYLLETQPLAPIVSLNTFYESNSGESITIDATPSDGYPTDYTYQWFLNGFPVPENFGGTASSYTINGTNGNNGTWKVEVTNDTGTTSAEFEYRVFTDSDGDGLSNYRESNITNTDPDLLDSDSDGLNDYAEVVDNLTDPNDSDSDDDGLSDGAEVISHLTDPNDSDSDDDGLSDGAEVNTHSTDPKDTDSDDDGLLDGAEVNTHLTNPNLSDTDSDNLSDAAEINTHLTNPNLADTDSDGLNDGAEVNTHSTDPLASDSSGDGLSDGFVVSAGFAPNTDYSALLTGRYSLSQLEDARTGAVMIEATGSTATLQLQIERSEDLTNWTQHEDDLISVPMQMNGNKQFFRFAIPQE